MLRTAIVFFVIALLAYALGFYNVAGLSVRLGEILFVVFVALAALSYLMPMITGRKAKSLP